MTFLLTSAHKVAYHAINAPFSVDMIDKPSLKLKLLDLIMADVSFKDLAGVESLVFLLKDGYCLVYDIEKLRLATDIKGLIESFLNDVREKLPSKRAILRGCYKNCPLRSLLSHVNERCARAANMELLRLLYEVTKIVSKNSSCSKCALASDFTSNLRNLLSNVLNTQRTDYSLKLILKSLMEHITTFEVIRASLQHLLLYSPTYSYRLRKGLMCVAIHQGDERTLYRTLNMLNFNQLLTVNAALLFIAKEELNKSRAPPIKLKILLDRRKSMARDFFYSQASEYNEDLIDIVAYRSVGLQSVMPLLLDEQVEEFFIDRVFQPIYLTHRDVGPCDTNIVASKRTLEAISTHLKIDSGYQFNRSNPTLRATITTSDFLIRVSAESPPLTLESEAFSIRKLSLKPFSIVKLIKLNTITVEAAAYLIFNLLRRRSFTIFGESGSGKTTLAIALDLLTPPKWRKICIESEIAENVDQSTYFNKHQLRIVLPAGISSRLRERVLTSILHKSPSYVFMGEVLDSVDVYFILLAANAGIKSIHTCHAESIHQLISRWCFQYKNDIRSLLNLDIFILMRKTYDNKRIQRKLVSIFEVRPYREVRDVQRDPNSLFVEVFSLESGKGLKRERPFNEIPSFIKAKEQEGISWVELVDELRCYEELLLSLLERDVEDPVDVTFTFYQLFNYLGKS